MADIANPNADPARSNSPLHQPLRPGSYASTLDVQRDPSSIRTPSSEEMNWQRMSVTERQDARNRQTDDANRAADRRLPPDNPDRRIEKPVAPTDAEYGAWTIPQRAAYAYQFQQWERSQAAAGGGGDAPGGETNPADAAAAPIKVGDLTVSESELRDYLAEKNARESGKLSAPASPADYQAVLPASFKVPEGIGTFAVDESAPELQQFRQFAHAHEMSQAAFSEVLSIYAGLQAREATLLKAARDREVEALGAAAPARVDAVMGWVKAKAGNSEIAASVGNMLVTEKIVRFFEGLMHQSISQGAGNFSQQHRDHASAEPSDEAYASMSFAEKMDYARSHGPTNGARR